MSTTTITRPASEKQTAFIGRLLGEKVTDHTPYAGHTTAPAGLTSKQASMAINALLAMPNKARADRPANAEPGYYTDGTDFIVVVANKAKTSTYAKVLTLSINETGRKSAKWTYAPGVAARLSGMHPMTLAEAKSFGHMHGFCFKCGKALTDPKSVEAGIGPVCAKAFA